MSTIIAIEKIRREAIDAVSNGQSLLEACPYPFHSPEGLAFRDEFKAAEHAAKQQTEGETP